MPVDLGPPQRGWLKVYNGLGGSLDVEVAATSTSVESAFRQIQVARLQQAMNTDELERLIREREKVESDFLSEL